VTRPAARPSWRSPALPARTRLAGGLGVAVADLSRRLGGGGGSVIGGRVILAVDPDALRRLAARRQSVVVSGTNGKTTTTSLVAAGLSTLGPSVSNVLGANLPAGVAAALAAGAADALAALEVDEAWLASVTEATSPAVAVLLNLSRDQLDRNNEVRTLAAAWRRCFAERPDTLVVANADDPLVAWAAGKAPTRRWVAAGQPWTADATACPACGGKIRFEPSGWACGSCSHRRPSPDVWLEGRHVVGRHGLLAELEMRLPGRANLSNATMALVACSHLGVDASAAAAAMGATTEVVGRYRRVRVEGVEVRLLLAKNPAGWLEVLDVLAPGPAPVVVVINARVADGRDPSWLWDVPFEHLAGRRVVAAGERASDLAVRLRYAEVDHHVAPDPVEAVVGAAREARRGGHSGLDVVANYTSFQTLRGALG